MALQNPSFKISKLTDKDWISRLATICSGLNLNVQSMSVNLSVGGHIALSGPLDKNPEFAEILALNSEVISSLSMSSIMNGQTPSFSISLFRAQDQRMDNASINFGNFQDQHKILAAQITSLLRKSMDALDSVAVAQRDLGDALKAQFDAGEERLRKLEGISHSLIFDQENYRQELEKKYQKRVSALEDDINEQKKQFEAKESALDSKIKAVDDRASRHARRALADKLKKIFETRAEKFNLSSGTVELRTPIKWFTIILLSIFGGLFILSSLAALKVFGLSMDSTPEHIIRQIGLAVAFASTSVFYLLWNNSWFEKHSNEEFLLKRLEIDVDRASWVVELASEWLDREREIPDALMSKLTTNLFEYESKEPEPLHPADQLASAIFGASSKATVKVGNGTELEFDRKSHKEMSANK